MKFTTVCPDCGGIMEYFQSKDPQNQPDADCYVCINCEYYYIEKD